MQSAKYYGARGTTKYTTEYNGFRGVDFASAPESVDTAHSPDALNVYVDSGGVLRKRPGYRTLREYSGKRIYGIHRYNTGTGIELVIHAGTEIRLYSTNEVLYSGANESASSSVVCGGKLWILTGREYLTYDGKKMQRVSDIAYIPTLLIGCDPKTGSGTKLESVNLISDKRKISYHGDGLTRQYAISGGYDEIISVEVNSVEVTAYNEDAGHRSITFTYAPSEPFISGEDNVIITYKKSVSGYASTIEKCRYIGLYGLGGADSDRVFFTGNPDKKNVDWHCDISAPGYNIDPTYIPDTSFSYIGSDASAICGYRRFGSYQIIIKEQNAQDATVYLRKSGLDENGEAYFSLMQGAAGIGAVSPGSIASLGDEPLFLSRHDGICGITSSYVTQITSVQNRSWFIDRKLKSEPGLENAVAVSWDGKYLLCVNNHIYLLDSRVNKTYKERSGGSYVFEAFYWEGIPAICFCECDGVLYFGTASGSVCRLSTDLDPEGRYRDISSVFEGEDSAIRAYWCTAFDDDKYPTRNKSINSHWLAIQASDTIGRVKASFRRDESEEWIDLRDYEPKLNFDFGIIDFANFKFSTGKQQWTIPIHTKIKKYKRLQFRIENSEKGRGLSLSSIIKTFVYGDFNKLS